MPPPAWLDRYAPGSQLELADGARVLSLARDGREVEQSLRLRHETFFREGLGRELPGGLDHDQFDPQCDHLLVRERDSGRLLGSFRLNLGGPAGLYSQTKFRLEKLLSHPARKLEIGRACVAKSDREGMVFLLLVRGILHFARVNGVRYVFGCGSIRESMGRVRMALCRDWLLLRHPLPGPLMPDPLDAPGLPDAATDETAMSEAWEQVRRQAHSPLPFYLSLGAMAGCQPFHDRTLGVYEFFTLLDLDALSPLGKRLERDVARLSPSGSARGYSPTPPLPGPAIAPVRQPLQTEYS